MPELYTESSCVEYGEQLRRFHSDAGRTAAAQQTRTDFLPENVGDWFYRQIVRWSKSLPNGQACVHVFRKTTLQYARSGEDVNRRVAEDARLGEGVLMTSYVKETDEQMREKSNRMFRRIANSLTAEVAARFGFERKPMDCIAERLDRARAASDWKLVAALADQLAQQAG